MGKLSNRTAAVYLRDEFSALGLETRVQRFPFLGWDIESEPALRITSPEEFAASVALMEYSGSTTEEGVEGRILPAGTAHMVQGFLDWPRLAVVDDNDDALGYLVVHEGLAGWEGPAIPLHNPDPLLPFPMAILAEADAKRIQKWLKEGVEVRASFSVRSRFTGPTSGWNVVARLPGERSERVVFTAHLDTAYGSAGANNNACGIEACHRIARRLAAGKKRILTYEFLFPDACERGYLGSYHYLREEERADTVGSILANINVDTVSSGDSLYFLSHPEDMRRRAERVTEELDLKSLFKEVTFLGKLAGSDHYSFLQAGIPAAELLFWPCEVYKTPEDDAGAVDEGLIERSVDIALALANTYEEDLI